MKKSRTSRNPTKNPKKNPKKKPKKRSKKKKRVVNNNIKKKVFICKDITTIDMKDYLNYEYLYFRNLGLERITIIPNEYYHNLRVIDISCNYVDNLKFLQQMMNIVHVFASYNKIRSFKDVFYPPMLETLAISNNLIESFNGLDNLECLKVLNVSGNRVNTLDYLPSNLKALEILDVSNNPVIKHNHFINVIVSLLSSASPNLFKVNSIDISKLPNLKKKSMIKGKLIAATKLGFNSTQTNKSLKADIDEFFCKRNIDLSKNNRTIKLIQMKCNRRSLFKEGRLCKWIDKMVFICDKCDVVSENNHLIYYSLKNARAKYVFINGIKVMLRRGGVVNLLLNPGEYKIKYSTDRTEKKIKISKSNIKMSKDPKYSLNIDWLRGNKKHIGHDKLYYTPSIEDIGFALNIKISVIDLVDSSELFNLLFITDEISPGLPLCKGLKIKGKLIEGETLKPEYVYQGGKEGQTIIQFYQKSEKDIKRKNEYQLSSIDVGKIIICEVTPYREDGEKGQTISIESESIIQSCPPSIKDIHFDGELKEGHYINLKYSYYGGKEGDTLIEWYRKDKNEQDSELVYIKELKNKKSIKLNKKDMINGLKVIITPFNDKGENSESIEYSISCNQIQPSEPKGEKLKIQCNSCVEGQTLNLKVNYVGGIEGKSVINWIRIDKKGKEIYRDISNKRSYLLTQKDIGCVIKVEYTPKRVDGKTGEVLIDQTIEEIQPAHPICLSMHLSGHAMQDKVLECEKKYFGGLESEKESQMRWYRYDGDGRTLLKENSSEYRCESKDVGCRIQVEYLPVRKDGVKSDRVYETFSKVIESIKPLCSNVIIVGRNKNITSTLLEGSVLVGKSEYHGGIEKKRNHQWFRVKNHGTDSQEIIKIENISSNVYTTSFKDVGYQMIYSVQPIRSDNLEGVWCESKPSVIVKPLTPSVKELRLFGQLKENKEIKIEVIKKDNSVEVDETRSKIEWYRVSKENKVPSLLKSGSYKYLLRREDVGYQIKIIFTPCRKGYQTIFGSEFLFETETSVIESDPICKYCYINGKGVEDNILDYNVKYYGGKEGESRIEWFRIDVNDSEEKIERYSNHPYQLRIEDVGCKIKLVYTPVRCDGLEGTPSSDITSIIKPCPPKLEVLKIIGELLEGNSLGLEYTYKGRVNPTTSFRWYRVNPNNLNEEELVSLDPDYILTAHDIGYKMKVLCVPKDDDSLEDSDNRSNIIGTVTDKIVLSKEPAVRDVRIMMSSYVTQSIYVDYVYEGGFEGASMICWFVSATDCGPWKLVKKSTKLIKDVDEEGFDDEDDKRKEFYLHCDYLMRFVKVGVVPIRKVDNKKGDVIYNENPVQVILGRSSKLHRLMLDAVRSFNSEVTSEKRHFLLTPTEFIHNYKNDIIDSEWPIDFEANIKEKYDRNVYLKINGETIKIKLLNRVERDKAVLLFRLFHALNDPDLIENVFGNEFRKIIVQKKIENIHGIISFLSTLTTAIEPENDTKSKDFRVLVSLV